MQRPHFTVCAVCSACLTIKEGFIPPILLKKKKEKTFHIAPLSTIELLSTFLGTILNPPMYNHVHIEISISIWGVAGGRETPFGGNVGILAFADHLHAQTRIQHTAKKGNAHKKHNRAP